MFSFFKPMTIPTPEEALPGRPEALQTSFEHFVNGHPLHEPFPSGLETAIFGMGCFWGAERLFWQVPGVYTTAVGYAAGVTPNPTYEEVCTGRTGHNEVVLVVFDPTIVSYETLVRIFFENHNPTQGMRQGNDVGTQYRSGIYATPEQQAQAQAVKSAYEGVLLSRGYNRITTEITDRPVFYYAESYHQQYLAKNPLGYCGIGGLGLNCPVGTGLAAE